MNLLLTVIILYTLIYDLTAYLYCKNYEMELHGRCFNKLRCAQFGSSSSDVYCEHGMRYFHNESNPCSCDYGYGGLCCNVKCGGKETCGCPEGYFGDRCEFKQCRNGSVSDTCMCRKSAIYPECPKKFCSQANVQKSEYCLCESRFYGPSCDKVECNEWHGIVRGSKCLCKPGKFGETCSYHCRMGYANMKCCRTFQDLNGTFCHKSFCPPEHQNRPCACVYPYEGEACDFIECVHGRFDEHSEQVHLFFVVLRFDLWRSKSLWKILNRCVGVSPCVFDWFELHIGLLQSLP